MTKVIFQVSAEQSPMAFGQKNYQEKRKQFIPFLYKGKKGCDFCGSDKNLQDVKEDNGMYCLVCPDCKMGID
jgi:hypothetical protein